jgi:hypothetical protein
MVLAAATPLTNPTPPTARTPRVTAPIPQPPPANPPQPASAPNGPEQRPDLAEAHARINPGGQTTGRPAVVVLAQASPDGTAQLTRVLNNIRTWLMRLLITLATVLLTVGGVRYLIAGGDPGEVEAAKRAVKSAAIGYILAALAPALVAILRNLVGL